MAFFVNVKPSRLINIEYTHNRIVIVENNFFVIFFWNWICLKISSKTITLGRIARAKYLDPQLTTPSFGAESKTRIIKNIIVQLRIFIFSEKFLKIDNTGFTNISKNSGVYPKNPSFKCPAKAIVKAWVSLLDMVPDKNSPWFAMYLGPKKWE